MCGNGSLTLTAFRIDRGQGPATVPSPQRPAANMAPHSGGTGENDGRPELRKCGRNVAMPPPTQVDGSPESFLTSTVTAAICLTDL